MVVIRSGASGLPSRDTNAAIALKTGHREKIHRSLAIGKRLAWINTVSRRRQEFLPQIEHGLAVASAPELQRRSAPRNGGGVDRLVFVWMIPRFGLPRSVSRNTVTWHRLLHCTKTYRPMNILLTGAAGFCGLHVALVLLRRGDSVVGIDNFSAYYDPTLKRSRIAELAGFPNFTFIEQDICDGPALADLIRAHRIERVVHLAAQPGVRYSLSHPEAYVQSNLVGFANMLEACRHGGVAHLVYASSSSVYGANTRTPYAEHHAVDHPVSFYAATKKANELLAHSYSHLYGLPTTGLRYFTVYGPWGRPDMAPWLFTESILAGRPIKIFNQGKMVRDFTFVEDIAEATVRALDRPAAPDPQFDRSNPRPDASTAPYRIYNVGNQQPVLLMDFIATLEAALGRTAVKEFLPMQPGDLEVTRADVSAFSRDFGFAPDTHIGVGVKAWVEWYKRYHAVA